MSKWLNSGGHEKAAWVKELAGEKKGGLRSRLGEMMENLPSIKEWRATLTPYERAEWAGPKAVLQHWDEWKREKQIAADIASGKRLPPKTPEPAPTPKEEIKRLKDEIRRLIANGGNLFDPNKDTAKDIAGVLYKTIPEPKLRQVMDLCYGALIEEGFLTEDEIKKAKAAIRGRAKEHVIGRRR